APHPRALHSFPTRRSSDLVKVASLNCGMASDPAELPDATDAVQELPPTPLSGTRAQAIQRLQVGLFGLTSMVLLVGLASVIKANVQQNEATVVPEAASTVAAEKSSGPSSDPLADAGI